MREYLDLTLPTAVKACAARSPQKDFRSGECFWYNGAMKAICLLQLLTLASLLSGCAHTANVPMSYAKLDVGYLDSGNYDLGWIFLWDRTERTLTSLPPLKVPDRLKDVGKTVDQQQGTLSADTDVELSADLTKTGAASGELQGRIARSTTTELDKFARETVSADDLLNLNNKATRAWRKRLLEEFPGDNFRFVLVDRVLRGNKVSLAFNSSGSGSVGANILAYGNLKVKVTYDGNSSFVETGKGVPLVFQTHIFKLAGNANNPEFRLLTGPEATQFNFQKAIKREQF
jgi:hypothetical protein